MEKMFQQEEKERPLQCEKVVEEKQEAKVMKNKFLKHTIENPQLNQYWYSAHTISVLVKVRFLLLTNKTNHFCLCYYSGLDVSCLLSQV